MDVPAEIVTGIATGGAVVGGIAMRVMQAILGKKDDSHQRTTKAIEQVLREIATVSREQTSLLRESRDILLNIKSDNRVLELKIDSMKG